MEKQLQEVRDLIYFFTHNKQLTQQQQARRDKLLARDCLGVQEATLNKSVELPQPTDARVIKYVPPKHLHDFLYAFNQDPVLKYTCHEIDTDEVIDDIKKQCETQEYNFSRHSAVIGEKLKELLKKFPNLDKKFIGMLTAYIGINEKKEWSSLKIKTCWNSPDILEWSNKHKGIIPSPGKNIAKKQKCNGFKMKEALESNLTGDRIWSFKDLVIYFKSLFHIRRDNSLRRILEYQNGHEIDIKGMEISFSAEKFDESIELLTDVDKLVQAYKKILKICKDVDSSCITDENRDSNIQIELSLFYESENCVYFTIHDKSHHYGKTLEAAKTRIGASQTELIRNQINGLCDLYIEADFGHNKYAKIGLWHPGSAVLENGKEPNIPEETLDKAEGVKYILKFDWK